MSTLKERFIDEIIETEGGFIDDPDDSGGPTNFGITEEVARENGYFGDMKDLPRDFAVMIYENKYWHPLNLDVICQYAPPVAEELSDTGVNCGIVRAGLFLQECLNALNDREKLYPDIEEDGQIGSATLRAFGELILERGDGGINVLVNALNCLQGAHYIELSQKRKKDEKFVYGWFKNRVRIS